MFIGSYDFCVVENDIIPEYFSGDSNTDGPGIIVKIHWYINHFIVIILDVNLEICSKKAFKEMPIKKNSENWTYLQTYF